MPDYLTLPIVIGVLGLVALAVGLWLVFGERWQGRR